MWVSSAAALETENAQSGESFLSFNMSSYSKSLTSDGICDNADLSSYAPHWWIGDCCGKWQLPLF
ncbi:hypothetical protein SLEP1_g24087 [Rubroshorea leprosula]|uniref:Uncharacterized protein n=1 Tax=Rubroshorea leprosula TaxID=152421 RepID=A0AAV5JLR5_9ROSI|nr:hypothetical protein SLEP1_g24087 [Rubroshorea leprosula]